MAVASVHGLVASPFKSAYVSAKHGLLEFVQTLALEGAEHGILATAVCPGYVRTPLVEDQVAAQAQAHGVPEDEVLEEVILAPHAVKRLIEPAEVADTVAFLLGPTAAPSPARPSRWITAGRPASAARRPSEAASTRSPEVQLTGTRHFPHVPHVPLRR